MEEGIYVDWPASECDVDRFGWGYFGRGDMSAQGLVEYLCCEG